MTQENYKEVSKLLNEAKKSIKIFIGRNKLKEFLATILPIATDQTVVSFFIREFLNVSGDNKHRVYTWKSEEPIYFKRIEVVHNNIRAYRAKVMKTTRVNKSKPIAEIQVINPTTEDSLYKQCLFEGAKVVLSQLKSAAISDCNVVEWGKKVQSVLQIIELSK